MLTNLIILVMYTNEKNCKNKIDQSYQQIFTSFPIYKKFVNNIPVKMIEYSSRLG